MSESRYTPEQLRQMAREFIRYVQMGDPRCMELMNTVASITGMSHEDVAREIKRLADIEVTA